MSFYLNLVCNSSKPLCLNFPLTIILFDLYLTENELLELSKYQKSAFSFSDFRNLCKFVIFSASQKIIFRKLFLTSIK